MILLANVHHSLRFLAFFLLVLRPWYIWRIVKTVCFSDVCMCIVLCVKCVHSLTHFLTWSHVHHHSKSWLSVHSIFMCIYPPCYTPCFYGWSSMTDGQSSEIISMLGSWQEVRSHWCYSLWPSSAWILQNGRVYIHVWCITGVAWILWRDW